MSPSKQVRRRRRLVNRSSFAEAILVILGSEPGLKAGQIAYRMASYDIEAKRADVNSALYGPMSKLVSMDDSNSWYLAGQNYNFFETPEAPAPSKTASTKKPKSKESSEFDQPKKAKRRLWTEDETILAYWMLPLMRSLARLTEREFSSIAMKLANLLAAETEGAEGLPNNSTLDRAVVAKFKGRKIELEKSALELISDGQISHSRVEEIRPVVEQLLSDLGVPLHVDVLATALLARNPIGGSTANAVTEALRSSPNVVEGPTQVFRLGSNPPDLKSSD